MTGDDHFLTDCDPTLPHLLKRKYSKDRKAIVQLVPVTFQTGEKLSCPFALVSQIKLKT